MVGEVIKNEYKGFSMHIRNKMLVGMVLSALSHSARAYVYEYKKLYRESTRTMIDLLYDRHVSIPDVNIEQFLELDPKVAKKKLYLTEQKVLETLSTLSRNCSTCDLVWETASRSDDFWSPVNPRFIVLHSFFRIGSMRNIRFIAADRHRKCGFISLFRVFDNGSLLNSFNSTGCSFDDPIPLSSADSVRILEASGYVTWMRYNTCREKAIKDLKSYFRVAYYNRRALDYTKDFVENDAFHALCDLEILSHVLASKSQRVVVYAGGWHCENVSEFLKKNGFRELCHQRNPSCKELPVWALAPFEHTKATVTS